MSGFSLGHRPLLIYLLESSLFFSFIGQSYTVMAVSQSKLSWRSDMMNSSSLSFRFNYGYGRVRAEKVYFYEMEREIKRMYKREREGGGGRRCNHKTDNTVRNA